MAEALPVAEDTDTTIGFHTPVYERSLYELRGVCHSSVFCHTPVKSRGFMHMRILSYIVCVSSAMAEVYTMLRKFEWCYNGAGMTIFPIL